MSNQNWNPNDPYSNTPQPNQTGPQNWDPNAWAGNQQATPQPNYPNPNNPQPQPTGTWPVQQQWGQNPAPQHSGGLGGFMRALFDLNFHKYVTPSIIKLLYILSMIGVGLYWIGSVIALFGAAQVTDPWTGQSSSNGGLMFLAVADLLFGWIFALVGLALIRMQYEFILAAIRTSEYARDIKVHLGAPEATL